MSFRLSWLRLWERCLWLWTFTAEANGNVIPARHLSLILRSRAFGFIGNPFIASLLALAPLFE